MFILPPYYPDHHSFIVIPSWRFLLLFFFYDWGSVVTRTFIVVTIHSSICDYYLCLRIPSLVPACSCVTGSHSTTTPTVDGIVGEKYLDLLLHSDDDACIVIFYLGYCCDLWVVCGSPFCCYGTPYDLTFCPTCHSVVVVMHCTLFDVLSCRTALGLLAEGPACSLLTTGETPYCAEASILLYLLEALRYMRYFGLVTVSLRPQYTADDTIV